MLNNKLFPYFETVIVPLALRGGLGGFCGL